METEPDVKKPETETTPTRGNGIKCCVTMKTVWFDIIIHSAECMWQKLTPEQRLKWDYRSCCVTP
jgi:hypothetical protein